LEDTYKHKGQRNALVNSLAAKGISDKQVLEAVRKVPRHYFFEPAFESHAYQDKAFPIGEKQTISQPYTVAYQSELLQVKKGDKILEIGTGSGYQACVLLEMGCKVYTIECIPKLYERTKAFLPSLGYYPLMFLGDGTEGLEKFAPYKAIIVTAGAPAVPEPLIKQLDENGHLVIPVGDNQLQKMVRFTKLPGGRIKEETFDNFSFVPLKGHFGWHD
jgi:protein-L-isoaspartate(D-aspartate) O-methyltransferase